MDFVLITLTSIYGSVKLALVIMHVSGIFPLAVIPSDHNSSVKYLILTIFPTLTVTPNLTLNGYH